MGSNRIQFYSFKNGIQSPHYPSIYLLKRVLITVLDLGWQTRHEGLDSEPRKHGLSPVCIPSSFSLDGALHQLVYIYFLSYQRARSRFLLFYARRNALVQFYFLFRLITAPRFNPFSFYFTRLPSVIWLPKDWGFVPIFLYIEQVHSGWDVSFATRRYSRSGRSKAWAPNDAGFRVQIVSKHDVLRLIKTTWASWERTKVAN